MHGWQENQEMELAINSMLLVINDSLMPAAIWKRMTCYAHAYDACQ